MKFTSPSAVLAGLAVTASARSPHHHVPAARQSTFNVSTATLDEFAAYALETANARIAASTGTCTSETVVVRKLFENLSDDEKIAYTDALLCLMELPAKTPSAVAPGAISRYDDFVTTHINQTLTIHNTGNFLGWHRLFLFEMEKALKSECGYTGAIPYWDWTKTANEGWAASAMVDGSATSLSGNGAYVEHNDTDFAAVFQADASSTVVLPLGTGSGCIYDGPFANMTVNLGPNVLVLPNGVVDTSGLGQFLYNPRCLKRDFTDVALTRYANETSVLNLLRGDTADIWAFQTLMIGRAGANELGVHGGGHYGMGGDPGRDVFVSPAEPLFWSHHANIDRVWWMWQMLDPETRVGNVSTAIRGSLTIYQEGNATLTDLQNVGYVDEGVEVELGQLLDNGAGILCTVYE